MRKRSYLKWVMAVAFLSSGFALAAPPVAKVKPLGIAPLAELVDPEANPIVTAGLKNVAVGTYIFLQGIGTDEDGDSITAYSWELLSVPSGSNVSLDSTGTEVQSFVPDSVGLYTLALVVTAGGEDSDPETVTVNASKWIGVGTICGATPQYPQCGLCHEDNNTGWASTGHATMFQRGINGELSEPYESECITCHTVGYNTATLAQNHGFDDVADSLGWTFPDNLIPSNFDSLCANYPGLAQLANIQCENCHGPGENHGGSTSKIDYTFNIGVCGQCHDEDEPHTIPAQWRNSKHMHSAGMGYVVNNESCVICHTAQGFVDSIIDGQPAEVVDLPEPVNCILCHDPHDATNEHQLRLYGDVTFSDTTLDASIAALCYECHNAEGAQPGDHVYHPQAEMLEGFGGYEYPGHSYPSGSHRSLVTEKCVDCHMAEADPSAIPDSLLDMVGGHSWSMSVASGSDTFYNTAGCTECHGAIPDFNVEGTQTLIESLLAVLDTALAGLDTSTTEYKQAKFNYDFVLNDGSFGVHNRTYAESLLVATINSIGVAEDVLPKIPIVFKLYQNKPNPFVLKTEIKYAIPKECRVALTIYDATGRRIRNLVNAKLKAGYYRAYWDGKDTYGKRVAAGIYFYTLETGEFTATEKMILLR